MQRHDFDPPKSGTGGSESDEKAPSVASNEFNKETLNQYVSAHVAMIELELDQFGGVWDPSRRCDECKIFLVRGDECNILPVRCDAASEDRTHDLRIMIPTRCQLRYGRYAHIGSSEGIKLRAICK